MADWHELADDSLRATSEPLRNRRYRSCISRAYYAGYAAVTGELMRVKGLEKQFYYTGNNPSHGQLLGLMEQLGRCGYSAVQVRHLKQAIRVLQRRRIEADYAPRFALGREAAREARRLADAVVTTLGRKRS